MLQTSGVCAPRITYFNAFTIGQYTAFAVVRINHLAFNHRFACGAVLDIVHVLNLFEWYITLEAI